MGLSRNITFDWKPMLKQTIKTNYMTNVWDCYLHMKNFELLPKRLKNMICIYGPKPSKWHDHKALMNVLLKWQLHIEGQSMLMVENIYWVQWTYIHAKNWSKGLIREMNTCTKKH
jgi:hypothetical protein